MKELRHCSALPAQVLAIGLVAVSAISQTAAAATNAFNEKTIKQWTHKGPLSETPRRTSELLPLSDQQNQTGWVRFDPMWDEFEGRVLDTNKWTVGMYWWQGRQPAWFNPQNVTVQNGQLHLTMRREEVPARRWRQNAHL